jgi:hypothetical protein
MHTHPDIWKTEIVLHCWTQLSEVESMLLLMLLLKMPAIAALRVCSANAAALQHSVSDSSTISLCRSHTCVLPTNQVSLHALHDTVGTLLPLPAFHIVCSTSFVLCVGIQVKTAEHQHGLTAHPLVPLSAAATAAAATSTITTAPYWLLE